MQVIVAEKFLMGRALARAYFGASAKAEGGVFKGSIDGVETVIASADGHLLEFDEPEAYDPRWRDWRIEDMPVVPPEMAFKICPRAGAEQQLRILERWLSKCDRVINACDAAREGELIFEMIGYWCGLFARTVDISRLWITDTTAAGLRRAWTALIPHTDKKLRILREQARTRAESDWLWGINLTRYATKALAGEAGLRASVVSVGRVRTPVLKIISDRCHAVHEHTPEPFYQAYVRLSNEDNECCDAKLLAPPELKFGTRDSDWSSREELEARIRHIRMSKGEPWTVVEGDNKPQHEYPPAPFDLTDLQRTANRLLGWSARRTLKAAQSLYAKYQAISYPRTDCYKLPISMQDEVMDLWWRFWRKWLPEYHSTVLGQIPDWEPCKENNFAEKITDHHAIIPTGAAPPSHDSNGVITDEYLLWDLVVRRFLTAWLPPAQVFASSRAFILPYVGGEQLRALVKAAPVLEPGWLLFEALVGSTRGTERKLEDRLKDKVLPDMGPTARLQSATPMRLKTHPPELFTYDLLLHAMDKAGLGTPATRAQTIDELISIGYIIETASSRLVVTEEGEKVVTLIEAHGGAEILDAKLTSFWEAQLDRVGKPGERGRTRLSILTDIVRQVQELGKGLTMPADVSGLTFCPATGLLVQEATDGWKFPGWPDVRCPRVMLSREMRAADYRDIFSSGAKGAGPYEFVSRNTNNPFKAWLRYEKSERQFKFLFKQRKG